MFTVCPKCALTLVVTATDLRVAQGYVRCGRCLNVFNALARLSEERPGATPAPPPEAAAPEEPADGAPPQPPAPSANDDSGAIEVELDASILVTASRAPTAPQETPEPEVQSEDAPAVAPAPASPATEPAAPVPRDAAAMPASAETSPPAQIPRAQETNSTPPRPADAFELVRRRSRTALAWGLGAGALAITLALQIVNHYRDALAANPALSGPLSTVYSALGVKLAPHWDVHAYEVRQLGASVAGAAAGEIVVRASVMNAASRPQPLPLLRVTLQDRFGTRIAARDVPPRDYLPSSVAPGSLLAAGSRVDATLVFVDPGPQAVGFEIDACLPLAAAHTPARTGLRQTAEVACAHGP